MRAKKSKKKNKEKKVHIRNQRTTRGSSAGSKRKKSLK